MAANFKTEIFDLIKNVNGYTYYKLFIGKTCQFDKFWESIKRIPRDEKSLHSIFSLMEMYGAQPLPPTKFKQIKGINRSDIFEFKKDKIRVYVIKQEPCIYIVMAGYKKDQQNDIKTLKLRLEGLNGLK